MCYIKNKNVHCVDLYYNFPAMFTDREYKNHGVVIFSASSDPNYCPNLTLPEAISGKVLSV